MTTTRVGTCRVCGEKRQLATSSGLICKPCKTESVRADRAANPEKWAGYRTRFLEKHPGIHSHYQRKHRYGITADEYVALLEQHEYKCAICGASPTRVHVDHDHETGAVRGILCTRCNQGLGMFQDDTNRLLLAIDYLKKAR